MVKLNLCLPDTPRPDDLDVGRHPKVKLKGSQGKKSTYVCIVCGQEFGITKE